MICHLENTIQRVRRGGVLVVTRLAGADDQTSSYRRIYRLRRSKRGRRCREWYRIIFNLHDGLSRCRRAKRFPRPKKSKASSRTEDDFADSIEESKRQDEDVFDEYQTCGT
mmetsp:Transcript_13956/g.32482  ORF Transcript_13956/g.32482 Transcript_13956/m.32482 type:complete len:111 (-) Transcript_13956:1063-1395(-)